MKKDILLKKIKELGYPLFETEGPVDANKTLAGVIKSKDPRLWEGFPLMLANSAKEGLFDYKTIQTQLKSRADKIHLQELFIISAALYKYLNLKASFTNQLYSSSYLDKQLFNKFLECFKQKKDLQKTGKALSSVRITNVFKNYFKQAKIDFKGYADIRDEFDLEYALSQVFSKKQKELFLKKLKGEKMTKTEREYYSRSVKKKIAALANNNLYNLAVKIIKE